VDGGLADGLHHRSPPPHGVRQRQVSGQLDVVVVLGDRLVDVGDPGLRLARVDPHRRSEADRAAIAGEIERRPPVPVLHGEHAAGQVELLGPSVTVEGRRGGDRAIEEAPAADPGHRHQRRVGGRLVAVDGRILAHRRARPHRAGVAVQREGSCREIAEVLQDREVGGGHQPGEVNGPAEQPGGERLDHLVDADLVVHVGAAEGDHPRAADGLRRVAHPPLLPGHHQPRRVGIGEAVEGGEDGLGAVLEYRRREGGIQRDGQLVRRGERSSDLLHGLVGRPAGGDLRGQQASTGAEGSAVQAGRPWPAALGVGGASTSNGRSGPWLFHHSVVIRCAHGAQLEKYVPLIRHDHGGPWQPDGGERREGCKESRSRGSKS
jgi:hypothetical protein